MTVKSSDLVFELQAGADLQHILYFVKRPTYELAFVVLAPHRPQHGDRGCCHLRFKTTGQAGGVVLDLGNVASFHADVAALLEYVRTEREKRRPSTLLR